MTADCVWLLYMATGRVKTTVYLDADVYRRLKTLSRSRSMTPAALIREAVAVFTDAHETRRLPRSIGAGASGTGDLASRVDEVLANGFGRDQ